MANTDTTTTEQIDLYPHTLEVYSTDTGRAASINLGADRLTLTRSDRIVNAARTAGAAHVAVWHDGTVTTLPT